MKKKIVLGVSGSIAAFKSAELASSLVQKGFDVNVVMTREAEEFITPLTLKILSCNKVYRGMFDDTEAWDVEHVSLADSCGLVLIAPATANCIGKLASGICDDLLTCVVTATNAPVLLAPAMNDGMYQNKIVQANIEKLKKSGYHFIGPVKGRLACGRVSCGRMSGIDDIVASVLKLVR
ncbi:MAG TPA: flavoprotein [Candidatus Omnitrophota bacterium]|nr:flavoprotein [Candidatus Omnitrophota bacterium]